MNILYVTSEAVPFCKTGGLADVAGSLPPSLAATGESVSVILPLYETVKDKWGEKLHFERWTNVRLAWREVYCGLFSFEYEGVTWYFIDNESYFRRRELYGHYDDGERFAFFSRAVTELLPSLPEKPDVVHCNDWQSALVPVYIRDEAVRNDFTRASAPSSRCIISSIRGATAARRSKTSSGWTAAGSTAARSPSTGT